MKNNKGYICVVQNNKTTNYLQLAYALALSIKKTQKEVNKLSIITDIKDIPIYMQKIFDNIIFIKNDRAKNKNWKLDNIIDLYDYTPYNETIMLDSDMLFLSNIDHWWKFLSLKDIWFTTKIKNYQNNYCLENTIYRQEFIKNKIPSVYNAFFYFKKSSNAEELFNMVKIIHKNWDFFCNKYLFKLKPKVFSTDVAFSLAIKLLGFTEIATFPNVSFPYFTHMKTQNQGWDLTQIKYNEDWTKIVDVSYDEFNNSLGIKISTVRQLGILHYHVKTFLSDEMIKILEK